MACALSGLHTWLFVASVTSYRSHVEHPVVFIAADETSPANCGSLGWNRQCQPPPSRRDGDPYMDREQCPSLCLCPLRIPSSPVTIRFQRRVIRSNFAIRCYHSEMILQPEYQPSAEVHVPSSVETAMSPVHPSDPRLGVRYPLILTHPPVKPSSRPATTIG